jgi:hypothetical protein
MSLNRGSFMTLSCKGSKARSGAQRRRMPWTKAKEAIASCVLSRRDKAIIDGTEVMRRNNIDRMSQLEPLAALTAVAAKRDYLTSTGKTLFQVAQHLPHHGRGQRFYRKEWMEGTCEKTVTLSSIEFGRRAGKGIAYGYYTFHGESAVKPINVAYAKTPGWHVDFAAADAVPATGIVAPPPSIGTDVPVDPAAHRVKAYPYYDAPNPPEFVERLLRERGVLPDLPVGEGGDGPVDTADDGDGSKHYEAK